MAELIHAGRLYIAQPPLFQIRRGRRSEYLQDEDALENYMLEVSAGSQEIKNKRREIPYTEEEAVNCVKALSRIEKRLADMSGRGNKTRQELVGYLWEPIDEQEMHEVEGESTLVESDETLHDPVDTVIDILESHTENAQQGELPLEFNDESSDAENGNAESNDSDSDTETPISEVFVNDAIQNQVKSDATIHAELSADIQCVKNLDILPEDFEDDLEGDDPLFEVSKAEDKQAAKSVSQLLTIVRSSSNRGMTLIRFKGLAEMNTKQLRETTMQIDERVLLQVTLEDAVHAERMFTLLMGESVEPRRALIERYGTQVELDVYGA